MKKIFLLNKTWMWLMLAGVVAIAFSCNKDFKNTLPQNNDSDSVMLQNGARKTLLIIVDGAVGTEVKNAALPNIIQLADFSIHSFDALADYQQGAMTNAEGWSNILTGVQPDKHKVTGDISQNDFADYPSLFTHLKQTKPEWRTSAFASSPDVVDYLATDATEKSSFAGDDAAVKDAVKNELASKDPVLVLAQFHDVDAAGAAGSYSASDAGYKAALQQMDAYIGEMLTALRARPSFSSEDWMVIITSSKGSDIASDPGGAARNAYNDSRRNTLFLCFNPRFNSFNPTKPGTIIPYIGTAPLYDGNNDASKSEVLDGGTTYDFGDQGSFTIQCKVKIKPGGYYYPAFIGKRESFDGGVPGWVFFLEGDIWQINFGQVGQNNTQVAGQSITDNNWHTLTAVIRQEGANRMVYTFTDGVPSGNKANIAGKGNINSPAPLTVGWIDGSRYGGGYSPTGYYVTDVRIYNEALTDEYIASNFCKINIADADPYLNNLIGFWPCTSVSASKEMSDLSGNNHPMTVDLFNSSKFTELSTEVCPDISEEVYRTVPNSVDVASQIYRWYGLLVPENWSLDGKIWIPSYSDVGG